MKFASFLIGITFLWGVSCQNQKATPDINSLDIELLRGEIILCSGKQFGDVNLSISCKNSVKETFNLAMALLHSFQYRDAEKAFVKVLDADPACAMAYWGVAMSIYHVLWFEPSKKDLAKGSQLLEIANDLPKSEKETMYINAISSFYENWESMDHMARAKVYERSMEAFYNQDSDDTEAAILYALALNSTADPQDKNYSNQRKAGEILETLFEKQPNHPGIAHYIIHNYDNPSLASKALYTARMYAEIAPSSSHAQHMPSHIFTRLGLWDESINSNLNSASSSQCYTQESGIQGAYFEEIHAIDYLVYAYLQKGNNVKAQEQYDHIKSMNKVNPANLPAVVYPFAAIPARLALENKSWEDAAQVELHDSEIQWEQFPWQKAIVHYARALGAAHINDKQAAEKEISVLQKLNQELVRLGDTYKVDQIAIQIKTAQAWVEYLFGNKTKALSLMKEASEMENNTSKHPVTPGEVLPAEELHGDMLLAMGRAEDALEVYENNLESRPNRFNGIYGAAVASKNIGNNEKAKLYFENLIELTGNLESKRPEIKEAALFLSQI